MPDALPIYKDRESIQREATELRKQVNDIACNTSFNGVKLTNGTTASIDIQSGSSNGQTIAIALTIATTTALDIQDGAVNTVTAGVPAAGTPVDTAGSATISLETNAKAVNAMDTLDAATNTRER